MRFKPQQQVVAIDGEWEVVEHGNTTGTPDPKANEIVTIKRYVTDEIVELVGYQSQYLEESFEPLMDISELTDILESQPAEV